jgi:hypothetical protein
MMTLNSVTIKQLKKIYIETNKQTHNQKKIRKPPPLSPPPPQKKKQYLTLRKTEISQMLHFYI